MNTNFDNISESEKNRILNMHINATKKQYLTEAEFGTAGEKPDSSKVQMTTKKILGSDLFKVGSSQINTNSAGFQTALSNLIGVSPLDTIQIQGGASAIPFANASKEVSDQKNIQLADRRAQNFVKALQDAGVKAKFQYMPPKMGVSKGGPEADKEQFVSYTYNNNSISLSSQSAIDNTAVAKQEIMKKNQELIVPVKNTELFSISYQITYNPNKFPSSEIEKALKSSLGGKVESIKNVTKICKG